MDIVALISSFVKALREIEVSFLEEPTDFYNLETSVKNCTDSFSAAYIGAILSAFDQDIFNSGVRKSKYTAVRHDQRTLLTTVGDVVFDCTYYKSRLDDSYHYLLNERIGLDSRERFSEAAEASILIAAAKHSYEEATHAIPSRSGISKTSVMNKVHGIAEDLPCSPNEQQKSCRFLYIDADEDHVAEQHGRWSTQNKGFISRLVYIYEGKEEDPVSGRIRLINKHYFSGVYEGEAGIRQLWEEVQAFIIKNYDLDALERIYINGDGASWIRSGTQYIAKSVYCVDKFHMSKYINAASNQMLDGKEEAKRNLYRLIHKGERKEFKAYLQEMASCVNNPDPVAELYSYALGNWQAVMRSYHDENFIGCSAEGHVSSVLSARLSSRPMGWSKEGADRTSRLRCFIKNEGEGKIIDLVRKSREEMKLQRTGTDDIEIRQIHVGELLWKRGNSDKAYVESIQASVPGLTVRKTMAIRSQMHLL